MNSVLLWHQVADAFVKDMIIEDRYMLILESLWTTVLITVFAAIPGCLVCWMRMKSNTTGCKTGVFTPGSQRNKRQDYSCGLISL